MDTGWEAVLKGGGWPAALLLLVAGIIKGPDLLRSVVRTYRGEQAQQEDRFDKERDKFWTDKDREMDRMRTEITSLQSRVDAMLLRIGQLMASISWWRDFGRDMRHERLSDRLLHQNYEQLHGIEPLKLEDILPVPRVSEEDTAAEFQTVARPTA